MKHSFDAIQDMSLAGGGASCRQRQNGNQRTPGNASTYWISKSENASTNWTLKSGKSVHKLPAAAGIGKRIDTLHVQVAKSRNDRHPEVGKGIDDLNLAIQIFPFISAILADFAGKRRGGGKSQTQGTGRYDKKVAYFHGRQVNK